MQSRPLNPVFLELMNTAHTISKDQSLVPDVNAPALYATGQYSDLRNPDLRQDLFCPDAVTCNGDQISGDIYCSQNEYIITTIPYDDSFQALTDGKETPYTKVNTALPGAQKQEESSAQPCSSCLSFSLYPVGYTSASSSDTPMVPPGIGMPKFSATVAPTTPKLSCSCSGPEDFNEGEYARKGTFSLVWSVPE